MAKKEKIFICIKFIFILCSIILTLLLLLLLPFKLVEFLFNKFDSDSIKIVEFSVIRFSPNVHLNIHEYFHMTFLLV